MKWLQIKSEAQIKALPIGSKIRVSGAVRLAADMYKAGGILTKQRNRNNSAEHNYGIHTNHGCCFLFDATEYEYLTT
jgi:hypothetical protein